MKESVKTTFNKDLFLSLCKKYNVELSGTATEPMIIIEKVDKNMKTRKKKYQINFKRKYCVNYDFDKIMVALRELMLDFDFDILSIKLQKYYFDKVSYIKFKCKKQDATLIYMMIAQRLNPWIEEVSF